MGGVELAFAPRLPLQLASLRLRPLGSRRELEHARSPIEPISAGCGGGARRCLATLGCSAAPLAPLHPPALTLLPSPPQAVDKTVDAVQKDDGAMITKAADKVRGITAPLQGWRPQVSAASAQGVQRGGGRPFRPKCLPTEAPEAWQAASYSASARLPGACAARRWKPWPRPR